MSEQILKKEDKLRYCANVLNIKKGCLVLSSSELFFLVHDKRAFSIPLTDILSVNCQKGVGTGNENMFVIYQDGGKERKVKIQHFSLMSFGTIGNLSRLGAFYFSSWEQAINNARSGGPVQHTSFDDLEKLLELKEKGVITEEEFSAKKKQLLGL